MKKLTTIFGVLAALTIVAGVVHKTYHLPGAFYLLMLGIGFFLMMYMVLLCINKIRESRGLERVMHIVKYLSYMYLALGTWFLIERFSGAIFMMDIGFGLFILGYLSLKFMVQRAKHPEGGALNKVLPSLIIAVLVFGIASRNMGERIFEGIAYSDMQVNKMTAASDTSLHYVMMEFEHNNSQFPAQMSSKFEKAVKIKEMSDSLVKFLNTCKLEVISLCSKEVYVDTLKLNEIQGWNKTNEPTQYFLWPKKPGISGKAYEISKLIDKFNFYVLRNFNTGGSNRYMIPNIFHGINNKGFKWKETGELVNWEISIFQDNMLINDIAHLDLLILSVRQTEKDIIASLLSDARAEVMWTFWKKYKELTPGQNTK
jgi:hypothetical protein